MDSRMERGLRAVIAVTFGVGVVLAAAAWPRVDAVEGVVFVLAYALAELLPARMRKGVVVSLCGIVALTALVVRGPELAVTAPLGVLLVARWRYPDRRVQRALFNFGQMTVSAAVAGVVFTGVGGVVGAPTHPRTWIAAIAAGTAFAVLNHALVAIPIRYTSGERIVSTLRSMLDSSVLLQVLYAALAVLAAALLDSIGPEAIVLLLVPMLVARHALLGYQRESEAYDRLVNALLKAMEVKDGYTAGHVTRVATLCVGVARELGMSYDEVRAVEYASKLHDVGKLGVPSAVINKPGRLDDEEFALIREHPRLGAEILAGIDFLTPAVDGVRYHHERVDGGGYPFGVGGDRLPLVARIITVCDAFDAMTTTRSYRRAMPIEDAVAELRRCAGTQFDARIVDVLEAVTARLGWTIIDEPFEAPAVHTHVHVPAVAPA